MLAADHVEIIPLGKACGAEIRGVDLKKDLSAEVVEKIADRSLASVERIPSKRATDGCTSPTWVMRFSKAGSAW